MIATAAGDQARIDSIGWYHEFDFGNGLRSRVTAPYASIHRTSWRAIKTEMAAIDFHGKSVLDVGCWDGYWSFYAERRGARRVLATDDRTQNWSDGRGLLLAHELLESTVEIDQEMSVYRLTSLGQTFDIILCLGVYYHLHDPFYALAQIRHCCHPNTLVVLEGAGLRPWPATDAPPNPTAMHPSYVNFHDHSGKFSPSHGSLYQLLQGTYLSVRSHKVITGSGASRLRWPKRFRACGAALAGRAGRLIEIAQQVYCGALPRVFLTCTPLTGVNEMHLYPPPFGLDRYDPRFASTTGA